MAFISFYLLVRLSDFDGVWLLDLAEPALLYEMVDLFSLGSDPLVESVLFALAAGSFLILNIVTCPVMLRFFVCLTGLTEYFFCLMIRPCREAFMALSPV